jgi:hypothetical protein
MVVEIRGIEDEEAFDCDALLSDLSEANWQEPQRGCKIPEASHG